jgi:hypothetical protein
MSIFIFHAGPDQKATASLAKHFQKNPKKAAISSPQLLTIIPLELPRRRTIAASPGVQ